jgi:hypothetical protein
LSRQTCRRYRVRHPGYRPVVIRPERWRSRANETAIYLRVTGCIWKLPLRWIIMSLYALITETELTDVAALERLENLYQDKRKVAPNAWVINTKTGTTKDISESIFPRPQRTESGDLVGARHVLFRSIHGGASTNGLFGNGSIRPKMPMPSRRSTEPPRRTETSTPSENAEPYQHPADHSWNLQLLLDLKTSIARLDERLNERTHALGETVNALRTDLKDMPGRRSFWTGIGLLVAVVFGLAGAYWIAFSSRLDMMDKAIQSLRH